MDALFVLSYYAVCLTVTMVIVTFAYCFVDVLVAAKEEAAKMLKGAREMAKRRAMDEEEKTLLGDIQRVRRMCALGAN